MKWATRLVAARRAPNSAAGGARGGASKRARSLARLLACVGRSRSAANRRSGAVGATDARSKLAARRMKPKQANSPIVGADSDSLSLGAKKEVQVTKDTHLYALDSRWSQCTNPVGES